MGMDENRSSSPHLFLTTRWEEYHHQARAVGSAGSGKARPAHRISSADSDTRLITHPKSPEARPLSGYTKTYYEKFCLSGGGKIKYPPKPKQQKIPREQEPLASIHQDKHTKGSQNDSRYVTRSVPVHSARPKEEDRGSNSAPMEAVRYHSNHDRYRRPDMPRLPKINNLVNQPLQQQVHGTSTATEAGRKDQTGKRWASSWADARANSSTLGETRGTVAENSHNLTRDSNHQDKEGKTKENLKTISPVKSSSPRMTNGASGKSPTEKGGDKVPVKESEVKRTEIPEPKTKNILTPTSKEGAVKGSKLTPDRRSQSSSQIETKNVKPLQSRSKSSAVLTNRHDPARQNSDVFSASSSLTSPRGDNPQIRVNTVSSDSQSVSTTQPRRPKPIQKKRNRKPVIITRKSLVKQKTLQSVYGNRTFKLQRQVRVLQKLEEIQKQEIEEFNRDLKEKEKHRMESIVRQRMALKRVRDKFDEEQVRRFRHQYVSWKSVEEDRLKRSSEIYGLPDFIYEDRYEKTLKKIPEASETASSSKKSPRTFKKYATWVRNIQVFEKLLNPKVGVNMEEAFKTKNKTIVEGIDTVKLDSDDSTRAKKVNVKRLIGSAKRLLSVTENMDDISEVSSNREDLSDDDSIDLDDDNDYQR